MDTYPIAVRSLEAFYKINGRTLEKNYKEVLSGFDSWEQGPHAGEWMLLGENIGESLCLDETMLQRDLTSILSNREGHCRKGSVVAAVRGTRAEDVIGVLKRIPLERRERVKEVTMDFSESMRAIAHSCFPNAKVIIDCFHLIKRGVEALEELRLRYKREAVKEQRRQQAAYRKRHKRLAEARRAYRKRHPKRYSGKRRGRKPQRLNGSFSPQVLTNGDTLVELLTRSRYLLSQSGEEWTVRQRARARILFEKYPKLREAYGMVCSLRSIFRDKRLLREEARMKLHAWYDKVAACTLREMKSVRDTIKTREEEVLNFFVNRSTNAIAESLNSMIKGFRTRLRGVRDISFFMYRASLIFG